MSQFTEQDLALAESVVRALVQYDREHTTDYSYSLGYHGLSGAQVLAQVLHDIGVQESDQRPSQGVPSFSSELGA